MFCCTETEREQRKRFETTYLNSEVPVMQEIERRVCGCDYGGNSWTTRQQSEALIGLLGLKAGSDLLDLGAGTGWPGIFLAKESGCSVTLVDLPEISLRIAEKRAEKEGLASRVSIKVADAADLPFEKAGFDAINHSDLLCCLVRKRDVLKQCRKVIQPQGTMAFTVISIAPDLSETQHARAIANAPEFAETDSDYRSLLEQTGWQVIGQNDLTSEYAKSCARQIAADTDFQEELEGLFGTAEVKERIANWKSKMVAIRDGLYLRELFLCRPATAQHVN